MTQRPEPKRERKAALLRAVERERWRCMRIIRESLDTGEYERSLSQAIITAIREDTP